MKHLLYLIGQPGSGKTTLVEALTAGVEMTAFKNPFAHIQWGYDATVVELGARRDGFAGTDALGMSVQPVVVDWLSWQPCPFVLGEGDRLGNSKFFKAVVELGYTLTVVRLAVSAAVAESRRAARAAALGTAPQNQAWLKGRVSKVRALAETWEKNLIDLDADQAPAAVLAQLLATEHPLLEVVASQR